MSSPLSFRPRLIDSLRQYDRSHLRADTLAGITVGIVALPLAMAFAIASGVPPQAGIITAVIGGFIVSAFGGSSVQIGGPTGAFIVILYGILQQYGATNLAICTIMAGVMLLVMGFAGLGKAIRFIPFPVTMGFTSGIAVMIFSTQVKDFFGLQTSDLPSHFIDKCRVIAEVAGTWSLSTTLLSITSLALITFWPKKWSRIVPGSIVALVVATLIARWANLSVETIGSRFGDLPRSFPTPSLPAFHFSELKQLLHPALSIALLAAIESLLSAVVADGMVDEKHDSNQELKAQGLANIVCPLFGGIAVTGAIARTATNVRCGGSTPIAGIIHAATLAALMLLAAPLAKAIPLCALSAVLVFVAWRMGEWHYFRQLVRWPASDAIVFLSTFFLTVIFDLVVAVQIGVILAAVLFIKRIADTTEVSLVSENDPMESPRNFVAEKDIPKEIQMYRMLGPLLFGASNQLETALTRTSYEPKIIILRMRKVTAIDATGLMALKGLYSKSQSRKQGLIISGIQGQPQHALEKSGFLRTLGSENVCIDTSEALERAKMLLDTD